MEAVKIYFFTANYAAHSHRDGVSTRSQVVAISCGCWPSRSDLQSINAAHILTSTLWNCGDRLAAATVSGMYSPCAAISAVEDYGQTVKKIHLSSSSVNKSYAKFRSP